MLAKNGVILELFLDAIDLSLERLIASHHEVVKYIVRVWDHLKHGQNGRVSDDTFSEFSTSQVGQGTEHNVVGKLLLTQNALQLWTVLNGDDLHTRKFPCHQLQVDSAVGVGVYDLQNASLYRAALLITIECSV